MNKFTQPASQISTEQIAGAQFALKQPLGQPLIFLLRQGCRVCQTRLAALTAKAAAKQQRSPRYLVTNWLSISYSFSSHRLYFAVVVASV